MYRGIENTSLNEEDTSRFFLLETKEGFFGITSWKARIIQWLHLERFCGVVYKADRHGLIFLEARIEQLFRESEHQDIEAQTKKFHVFSSLAHSLHSLGCRRGTTLLKEVHHSVGDLALLLFFRLTKTEREKQDESWYSDYGAIQAGFFVEKSLSTVDEKDRKRICEKFCEDMVEAFPSNEKSILSSFFSRVKKLLPSFKEIQDVEAVYRKRWSRTEYFEKVTKIARSYLISHKDTSPNEVALWLKSTLEDIDSQLPEESPCLGCSVIDLFRRYVLPWKLKEILRAYGSLLGQECIDSVERRFEDSCEHIHRWFPSDGEFNLVLDGLLGQKGREYCKAVAQTITSDGYESYLRAYIDRAMGLFSLHARDIIQGVVAEMLLRQENQLLESFCENLGLIFVHIFGDKQEYNKDFSVLTLILGGSITMPYSIHGKESLDVCRDSFLRIEQKVVSLMASDSSFLPFYGHFLANKIIEWARKNKEQPYSALIREKRSFYENFIRKTFQNSADSVLRSLRESLDDDPLLQLDDLVSSSTMWKKVEAFDGIVENMSKKFVGFCPALGRIAENFSHKFLLECQKVQKKFPQRPPLSFLYGSATNFSLAFLAIAKSLGMQGHGQQFFLNLLKNDERAESVIEWIKAALGYTREEYKERFSIRSAIPSISYQSPQKMSDRDQKLLDTWLPFIPDPLAVEKSLVRSSLDSISMNGRSLKCAASREDCAGDSDRLVQSCEVAEELLQHVPVALRTARCKKAIGRLLTYTAIEYDPSSVIPSNIFGLSIRLDIQHSFLGCGSKIPPHASKFVYRFAYAEGTFSVENDAFYPEMKGEMIADWWCVTSKQEIDLGKIEEVSVTFSSKVIQNRG